MSNSTERNGSKHHVTEHHQFSIDEVGRGPGPEFINQFIINIRVLSGGRQKTVSQIVKIDGRSVQCRAAVATESGGAGS